MGIQASPLGPAIQRFDVLTGKRQLSPEEATSKLEAVVFAPDDRSLYTFSDDGRLRSWETDTGREIKSLMVSARKGEFSPDGRLLAAWQEEGLALYETSTGKVRWNLPAYAKGVYSWAFSADGQLLAVSGWNYLAVLEVATGREIQRMANLPVPLYEVYFTSDRDQLVGHAHSQSNVSAGASLHFWDISTGRERRVLGLPRHLAGVALSPDNKTVAVPRLDWKGIEMIEVRTGQLRFTIDPPTILPCLLQFSPDGKLFLVSDREGAVRYHEASTGRLLLRRGGHRGTVNAWVIASQRQRMATLSLDRTILIWSTADVLRRNEEPLILSEDEQRARWVDLAASDAATAYRAMMQWTRAPEQAVKWIQTSVKPIPTMEPRRIQQLIAELDHGTFAVRENATRELKKLAESAEPRLRETLAGKPSLELRRRVEPLLEKYDGAVIDSQHLQALRAVEVLEHIGTLEARQHLQRLAQGVPGARLTDEAAAALERLQKQVQSATPQQPW